MSKPIAIKPHDTKVDEKDLLELINDYEEVLKEEMEHFERIANESFHFEQPYALIGSQGNIDRIRTMLYFLKKLVDNGQENVIYGKTKPKEYKFVLPNGKELFSGNTFTLDEIETIPEDIKILLSTSKAKKVEI